MKKAPISVRIIYVLSLIAFWALIVVTGVSFLFALVLQTDILEGNDFQLRVELPVKFDLVEVGTTQLFGNTNAIAIEDANAKFHIINTPLRFSRIIVRVVFAASLVALFMAWKFKLFITNIKNGLIFDTSNINNLKHISYGILIIFLIDKVYTQIMYSTVAKHLAFDSVIFNGDIGDRSGWIQAALLLWVLAHIFMKGVEMKEEQDLTV